MSRNFWKYAIKGTSSGLSEGIQAGERQNYLTSQEEKQRLAEQQKLDEEAQKQAEQQKYLDITSKLLKGGTTQRSLSIDPSTGGQNYFMSYTSEEKRNLLNQLPASYINRYQDILKETQVQEPKYKIKYDQPLLYKENKDTGERVQSQQTNPFYIPKVKNTVTDYNAKGEKVIKNFYEDGKVQEIPTGFYKKNSEKGGEGFDLNTYNKTINHFSQEDIKINNLKAQYQDLPTDALKYQINSMNFANEQTLYNLLDDNSKKIVNEFYDQMKKQFGEEGYKKIEQSGQDKLRKRFIDKISQSFDGSSKDYAMKRALILWARFKFGYINAGQ